MNENIEKDPESLLNRPEPMTDEEERYSKIKMEVTKLSPDAHPGLFTNKRKKTGYVSPRRKYYSTYYQKNKKKIKEQRKVRYHKSEAVRKYHREYTDEWREKHATKGKRSNRTVMLSDSGERLFTSRYACAAFGYSEQYFRTLCLRGVIPNASYRDARGWRLYTADQLALLKKAASHYEGTDPWKVQLILFTYWQDPKPALKMDCDQLLKTAKANSSFKRINKPKAINKIFS